jgi:hypothetical protein
VAQLLLKIKFKKELNLLMLATVLAAEKQLVEVQSILLDTQTLYINGTIIVDLPIELNNAYIGLDSGDDKLVKRLEIYFTGATGIY